MDDGPALYSPARSPAIVWSQRVQGPRPIQAFAGPVVGGDQMQELTVELLEVALDGVAQPRGAFDNRVEHRLKVSWRTTDDSQDLARGSLLLQGLREGPILLLELGEQPDVLDGDDCLICEGPEQRNLLFRERLDLESSD